MDRVKKAFGPLRRKDKPIGLKLTESLERSRLICTFGGQGRNKRMEL
jgi:hypothetical protein